MIREIIVVPGSKEEQVIEGEVMRIKVREKAENNKANIAVEKILSRYFGKPVKIVKGFKSKRKAVMV